MIHQNFRAGHGVSLDQQGILAGTELEVVPKMQRGKHHPHVQSELSSDGTDAREQVAVL